MEVDILKFKKYKFLRLGIAAVIMALAACACSGLVPQFAIIAQSQFAPAVMRFLSGAAWSGALVALLILLITRVAGRWYCALLCPMGTVIDLIDLIPFFRKRAVRRDLSFLRIFIFAIVITLAILGSNWGFMLLDPYANFGEISASIAGKSFHAGTIFMAAVIFILAIWKRRIFCTSICPVGTCLNLAASAVRLKLAFTDRCVNCKMCESSCPAGCIDVGKKTIDNARCVRCLECFDVCKVKALKFTCATMQQAVAQPETDNSRRNFIRRGSVALGGAVAGSVLLKAGVEKFAVAEPFSLIVPPGAESMARLRKKCISCLICVRNCPAQLIRPAKNGEGPVSLDFSNGKFCQWDCSLCSQVCPAGAIKELSPEEKQLTQIALPAVSDKCVGCGICVSACPAQAMKLDAGDKAAADSSRCAGCGKCAAECPHLAITMMPVSIQKRLSPPPAAEERSSAPVEKKKPEINHKVCFSCGACAEVCPVKAITLDDTGTPRQIDKAKCIACLACVKTCPAKAIK